MHEPAGFIEAAFQHDGVPVWIEPKKLTRRLIGQNHPRFDRPIGRFVVEMLNDDENESADFREQAAVVPKVWTQNSRNRPNELPVGQVQQEPFMHVLRKQERPLLRTGRAEVERFTGKWTEVLEFAVGIGALDTSDAPGVVPAKNELLNHLGDPLDTESAVDDSELAFVLFRDALKMLLKQNLKSIDSTRPVHPFGDRGDRKG